MFYSNDNIMIRLIYSESKQCHANVSVHPQLAYLKMEGKILIGFENCLEIKIWKTGMHVYSAPLNQYFVGQPFTAITPTSLSRDVYKLFTPEEFIFCPLVFGRLFWKIGFHPLLVHCITCRKQWLLVAFF